MAETASNAYIEGYFDDLQKPGLMDELWRGVRAEFESGQAKLYGALSLAGELLDIESWRTAGEEGYARNQGESAIYDATVETTTDIQDLGDIGRYVVHKLGTMLPSLPAFAIGFGAAAGLAARGTIKATKAGAAKAATLAGAVPVSAAVRAGGVYGGAQHEPGDDVAALKSLGTGIIAATFDKVPLFKKLEEFGMDRMAADNVLRSMLANGRLARLRLGGHVQAVFEGTGEALEGLIADAGIRWVENHTDILPDDVVQYLLEGSVVRGIRKEIRDRLPVGKAMTRAVRAALEND